MLKSVCKMMWVARFCNFSILSRLAADVPDHVIDHTTITEYYQIREDGNFN